MREKFSDANFRKAIAEKCPKPNPCPFCGKTKYAPFNKYTMVQVQSQGTDIQFGESIPAGIVVCTNCGHMNFFALSPLGLNP